MTKIWKNQQEKAQYRKYSAEPGETSGEDGYSSIDEQLAAIKEMEAWTVTKKDLDDIYNARAIKLDADLRKYMADEYGEYRQGDKALRKMQKSLDTVAAVCIVEKRFHGRTLTTEEVRAYFEKYDRLVAQGKIKP